MAAALRMEKWASADAYRHMRAPPMPSRTTFPGALALRAAAMPAKFAIDPPLTSNPAPSIG